MKRITQIAIAVVAAALMVPMSQAARAQNNPSTPSPPAPTPPQVMGKLTVSYTPPSAKYTPVMNEMKKSMVLEQLAKFLSPLRFPYELNLIAEECNPKTSGLSPHFSPLRRSIVYCYQFDELVQKFAPAEGQKSKEGLTRNEVITGAVWGVMLHEAGHALFEMLEVPVFGAEEDAADQIAILFALENASSKDVARAMIGGIAHFWREFAEMRKELWNQWKAYQDVHGADIQRYRNTVCLAYGSDRETFKEFIEKAEMSPERINGCAREYQQVKWAFGKTIAPFVNADSVKAARQQTWVTPQRQ